MPVPFETLIPYAIITTMFGITGAGLGMVKYRANGGKRARRSVDRWDRQSTATPDPTEPMRGCGILDTRLTRYFAVMERDERLTGHFRGQINNPTAPLGFEVNSKNKLEYPVLKSL